MPHPIYKRCRVDGSGSLPRIVSEEIRDALKMFSGRTVEITIRAPKRSKAANRYYWGVVIERIRRATVDAGQPVSAEALHNLFKARYLPPVEIKVLGQSRTLPPSTSKLDSTEFSEYVEAIRYDEDVVALGVQIPPPEGDLTSFRIDEIG